MRNNKKPFNRRCASCGRITDKHSLLRVVRNKEGHTVFDKTLSMEGRGAYICREMACVEKAEKKNSLERSFRAKIDRSDKEKLFEEIREFVSG